MVISLLIKPLLRWAFLAVEKENTVWSDPKERRHWRREETSAQLLNAYWSLLTPLAQNIWTNKQHNYGNPPPNSHSFITFIFSITSALTPYLSHSTIHDSEPKSSSMPPNLSLIIFLLATMAYRARAVGVNWGTTASHPLPASKVVELLKSNNITRVKLFDADPLVLEALSGSNLGVTVGIPNALLKSLNSSKKAAGSWVHDNVTRYVSSGGSRVNIEYDRFSVMLFNEF